MKFNLFGRVYSFASHPAPHMKTWGILNRTQDNFFLPFFDFDWVNSEVIAQEVDFLGKNFNIGPLMVRESTEGVKTETGEYISSFHLIGFKKLTLPEYRDILAHSRCDWGYKSGFRLEPERAWVLRVGEKEFKNGTTSQGSKFLRFYYGNLKGSILYEPLLRFFEVYDETKYTYARRMYKGSWWNDSGEVNVIQYEGGKKKLKAVQCLNQK